MCLLFFTKMSFRVFNMKDLCKLIAFEKPNSYQECMVLDGPMHSPLSCCMVGRKSTQKGMTRRVNAILVFMFISFCCGNRQSSSRFPLPSRVFSQFLGLRYSHPSASSSLLSSVHPRLLALFPLFLALYFPFIPSWSPTIGTQFCT